MREDLTHEEAEKLFQEAQLKVCSLVKDLCAALELHTNVWVRVTRVKDAVDEMERIERLICRTWPDRTYQAAKISWSCHKCGPMKSHIKAMLKFAKE